MKSDNLPFFLFMTGVIVTFLIFAVKSLSSGDIAMFIYWDTSAKFLMIINIAVAWGTSQ